MCWSVYVSVSLPVVSLCVSQFMSLSVCLWSGCLLVSLFVCCRFGPIICLTDGQRVVYLSQILVLGVVMLWSALQPVTLAYKTQRGVSL